MSAQLRGLEGLNVFITGAAKGQGFNHAKAFADAGANVALLDITEPIANVYDLADQAMLDAAVSDIRGRGVKAIALPCDLRDEAQVKDATAKALEFFGGRVDVIVNNAGVAALDTIQDMRSDVLDAVIDTIVKGHMYVVKYLTPNMIERQSGKIINITSGVTGAGTSNLSHYVAAKYALNGLISAWAFELGEFNINVNGIAPATIRPGLGQGSGMVVGLAKQLGMDMDEAYEKFSSETNMPGKKWRAEMQDITDAVLFLASENADMITGVLLPVDCGQAAR